MPNISIIENSEDVPKDKQSLIQKITKSNNLHYGCHLLRKMMETIMVNEQITMGEYNYENDNPKSRLQDEYLTMYAPHRPVVDINATRTMWAGVCKKILTPNMEGADKDRNRKTKEEVRQYNRIIRQTADEIGNEQFYEDGKVVTDDRTLQEVAPELDPDTLIITTDVIYYINDADMYEICSHLNDGTVSVGLFHCPKHYDNEVHDIITMDGCSEGSVRLLPNEPLPASDKVHISKFDFLMKTKGNNHYYRSRVRFPELRTQNEWVLRQPTDKKYDFILKVIIHQRADLEATDYISYSIMKITNPSMGDAIIEYAYTHNDVYQALRYVCNNAEQSNAERAYKITECYSDLIDTRVTNPYYYRNIEVPKVNYTLKKGQKKYTLVQYKNNRIFNSYDKITIDGEQLWAPITHTIDIPFITKLETKCIAAEKVDDEFLRTLIVYITRERKDLSMDQIIILVTDIIARTQTNEAKLSIIKNMKSIDAINKLKKGDFNMMPTGIIDAFCKGQLFNYINYKIRDSLKLNDDISDPRQMSGN
jgi:hypothetical protein